MTKEWQEASNERALEQKLNPITGVYSAFAGCAGYLSQLFLAGISSEGYKGPGFVQSK